MKPLLTKQEINSVNNDEKNPEDTKEHKSDCDLHEILYSSLREITKSLPEPKDSSLMKSMILKSSKSHKIEILSNEAKFHSV